MKKQKNQDSSTLELVNQGLDAWLEKLKITISTGLLQKNNLVRNSKVSKSVGKLKAEE